MMGSCYKTNWYCSESTAAASSDLLQQLELSSDCFLAASSVGFQESQMCCCYHVPI